MGVVTVTWRVLEFHTPWSNSGTAEVVKFCVLQAIEVLAFERPIIAEKDAAPGHVIHLRILYSLKFLWNG